MLKGIDSYYADTPAELSGKNYSKHDRSFLHDTNDDTIYLPAITAAVLLAGKDGIVALEDNDGCYLPITWYSKRFPLHDYEKTEKVIRTSMNKNTKGE